MERLLRKSSPQPRNIPSLYQKVTNRLSFFIWFIIDKSLEKGKISYSRESYLHDDPDQNPVDTENKIKGYYYGKQLVFYTNEQIFEIL